MVSGDIVPASWKGACACQLERSLCLRTRKELVPANWRGACAYELERSLCLQTGEELVPARRVCLRAGKELVSVSATARFGIILVSMGNGGRMLKEETTMYVTASKQLTSHPTTTLPSPCAPSAILSSTFSVLLLALNSNVVRKASQCSHHLHQK
jgi:hypothetical protein